ncbi:helix-turn-helix transcriptional regulator [Sphingobium sp. V4]|uniref:helix-turn-helix transcriptional regulator n=1 Tax=Sphingobium sp. V4 TaxID=3038927 RepID=UPI0025582D22|nr:helix-turn-helix transcriptional regulator [Sphingobium sp. V4]WIW89314.1 helix-turn-helix transcriptional regulator [Sphingobium sp. V4]
MSGLVNHTSSNYLAGMTVLSENIKALRRKFANQTEFGEKVGVGQSTVVRWEKGSDPKPENLLALASIADVTIEQLITTPLDALVAMGDKEGLPNEADFQQMIADALQEVPPGTPLSGYPPIVASSLRDRLALLLKHGGPSDSSAAATAPGIGALSLAPTKGGAKAGPRNP